MRLNYYFFFLSILGACARVPQSDLAQLSEPMSLNQSIDTALSREFFEEGGWPTEKWWEMFEDPQLNRLIELALTTNPTLQKALAKIAEVEQAAKEERASLFPTLSGGYTENWEYFSKNGFIRSFYPTPPGVIVPPKTNQLDLSLNFNYEIDFFGRNRKRFQAAIDAARAQRAESAQATLVITTLIAQTYIELQMKLAQISVVEERLAERNRLLKLTQSRALQGLDSAMPSLEKELRVYELEQSLLYLQKASVLDQHMLNLLVGNGPDHNLITEPLRAIFEKAIPLPKNLSTDLLARRPDLIAQIWRVESAANLVGAAKADFYPRVNLVAFAQLESLSFSKLLNLTSRQGGLDPAIHLPIFTGGRLTAHLKNKVALFNEETYQYNELILRSAKEVADLVVQLSTLHDTLSYQAANLELVQTQLDLQHSRYTQGLYDFLSVLEQEEAVFAQWYDFYGYQRDYLLSILQLIKALGGGYHFDNTLPSGHLL